MCPAKQESRFAKVTALVCAVALLLSSCAHRSPPPTAASTVSSSPAITAAAPLEVPKAAKPAPAERRSSLRALVPKTQPTRAAQIIALVYEGHVVDDTGSTLVFSKSGLTRSSRSGLYEDAILLARLRSTLNETPGLPDSVSTTATVRDAEAFLTIEDRLPASTAARVINAALRTAGIIAVQARIGG